MVINRPTFTKLQNSGAFLASSNAPASRLKTIFRLYLGPERVPRVHVKPFERGKSPLDPVRLAFYETAIYQNNHGPK